MIITIEEQDRMKALEEVNKGNLIPHCCLVFQACKRAGVPINRCGLSVIEIGLDGQAIYLPKEAISITRLSHQAWRNVLLPISFDIDYDLSPNNQHKDLISELRGIDLSPINEHDAGGEA